MRFVDANVLLFAISRDPGERQKRETAIAVLAERDLALSVQVLQEFYVQTTRSTREDALSHRQAVDLVTAFARFPVQPTTVPLVRAAMASRDRFGLSYWDAAIVGAARMLGCEQVLSEDHADGQSDGGMVVVNPFR